jgi:hypothetical protein
MKLTLTLLFSSILFVGCFNKLKKNNALADNISTAFETNDVEVFQGIATGEDGKHPFIDISIAGVPMLDNDTLYDITNVASKCALMTFDNLDKEERKNSTTIDVSVTRRLKGEERKFTYKYDVPTIKKVKNQLELINGVFNLWIKNEFEKSYNLFDERFIALFPLENYTATFGRAEADLGKIKSYEISGFDIVEMEIYGKSQKLIKYKTISYRNDPHSIVFFLEPDDKSKVLGINM